MNRKFLLTGLVEHGGKGNDMKPWICIIMLAIIFPVQARSDTGIDSFCEKFKSFTGLSVMTSTANGVTISCTDTFRQIDWKTGTWLDYDQLKIKGIPADSTIEAVTELSYPNNPFIRQDITRVSKVRDIYFSTNYSESFESNRVSRDIDSNYSNGTLTAELMFYATGKANMSVPQEFDWEFKSPVLSRSFKRKVRVTLVIQKGTTDGSFKLRISGNGIEANSLLGADGPSDTYSLKGLHEPCYLGRLNPNWICRYFLPEEIEDYYSETFESGKRFLIPYNDPRGLVIDIPVGSRSIVRDIGLKWKVSVGNGGDCRIKLGVFLEHPDGTTVAIPSSYSSYSGETHFGNHGRDGFDNPDLLVFHKKESEGAWKLKAIAVYDPDNANCSARDGTYLTDYRLTLAFGKLNGVSSVRP